MCLFIANIKVLALKNFIFMRQFLTNSRIFNTVAFLRDTGKECSSILALN